MSNEQIFEQPSEETLLASHRQWQTGVLTEPDIETMVEMHDVMASVIQRLAEHRVQPLRRTVGDIGVWSSAALLLLLCMDPHSGAQYLATPLLPAILLYNRSLHNLDRMQAALTLQDYDKRWIGPLLEALSWPNRRIRQIVRIKLLNLLPFMTESDARCLNQKHRRAIYTILEETHDTELKLVILKVIALFGDADAVPIVEKLAKARVLTRASYRIRRAALVCLPLLREQVWQQKTASLMETALPSSSFLTGPAPISVVTGTTEPEMMQDAMAVPSQGNSTLSKLEAERAKVARPSMRSAFLVADWLIIVPFGLYETVSTFASHQPLFAAVWASSTVAATQLYRVSLSSKRVVMMRNQAQQRDIRGVGSLAEALTWPEQDLQYEAASALTVLLPLLKANHASLLNATQRECLHQVLTLRNARTQGDLIVAILQAFQQVGDTAAIPVVEQLANAKPRSQHEQRVVLEAQECLPYLRLCASNNTASHSLLRASAMTATPGADNLLRPAREAPETRPEQLLRPSDSDSI